MGCSGGEGSLPSLGGGNTQSGGDNVDIGEDGDGEMEDKNDNSPKQSLLAQLWTCLCRPV